MNAANLQTQLFAYLKNRPSPRVSLVDEIATLLNISTDSAYRRIRGENLLSLEELCLLCTHFHLSVDNILNQKNDNICFLGKYIDPSSFRFEEYLAAVGQQVKYMVSFKQRAMYYLCKDIPLFHHYLFKELAAFKYFFWHKTLLQSPGFEQKKISLDLYPSEVFEIGRKALDAYNQLDSYEIWNMESLNGTLHQVEYFHDIKAFASTQDLLKVYLSLESLFSHIEAQAERGYKFQSDDPEQKPLGRFQMYFNEVVIGDNSILAVLDGAKVCFITHTGINFMLTRDMEFCENMHNYYQNLMRKSTLISSVSDRERSRFFNVLRKRIAIRKQNLGVSA